MILPFNETDSCPFVDPLTTTFTVYEISHYCRPNGDMGVELGRAHTFRKMESVDFKDDYYSDTYGLINKDQFRMFGTYITL